MSPVTLQQELNLSRRACCHRSLNQLSEASVSGDKTCSDVHSVNSGSKCVRSGFNRSFGMTKCVLLVLLGVLLCSFPAPTWGRPNGTAAGLLGAVQETQPNVSIEGEWVALTHFVILMMVQRV